MKRIKLKCHKHPDRRAVAIFNFDYPLCQKCVDNSMVEILNSGEMLLMAFQGEPKALIIPQKINAN